MNLGCSLTHGLVGVFGYLKSYQFRSPPQDPSGLFRKAEFLADQQCRTESELSAPGIKQTQVLSSYSVFVRIVQRASEKFREEALLSQRCHLFCQKLGDF